MGKNVQQCRFQFNASHLIGLVQPLINPPICRILAPFVIAYTVFRIYFHRQVEQIFRNRRTTPLSMFMLCWFLSVQHSSTDHYSLSMERSFWDSFRGVANWCSIHTIACILLNVFLKTLRKDLSKLIHNLPLMDIFWKSLLLLCFFNKKIIFHQRFLISQKICEIYMFSFSVLGA